MNTTRATRDPVPSHPAQHLRRGQAAETRACRHLRLRGWRICARNWIGGPGELDIVASRWRTLLVVEVRSRISAERALDSIDRAKLDRILRTARTLVHAHGLHRYRLRVDIIAIDGEGRLLRKRDVARTT
ncbi:MAG: YraN family protein [Planctomycetota bacterium]